MLLRGRLKTKDFLLQKNVDCDTCCVLCDCTWETTSHLMIHCPFSRDIWKALLLKLNLMPASCNDVYELLDSIISRIDQQSEGAITLSKLLFNAYVWNIWAERNCRIFRAKAHSIETVVHRISQVITTHLLYLSISLPTNIQCHQNVPPNVSLHTHQNDSKLICERNHGQRLSIVQTRQDLVGVLWLDLHQPVQVRIESVLNYYARIFRILEIVQHNVSSLNIETENSIQ